VGDVAGAGGRISLDGDGWRCRPYLGDEWQAARLGEQARAGQGGWLPATVPGSVVSDLWRAGEVPDPYFERNTRFAEWAADRWWAYQTDFPAPAPAHGGRTELVLEGIDYGGRVYLDGELLGEHEGMFVPARFEIGERLTRGRGAGRRHVLSVLIAPAPRGEPQSGDTARVRTHKARISYGWDFCPRLVHQGIWRSVWLRTSGPLRIMRPWIRPTLADDLRSARLDCELGLDSLRPGRAEVSVAVRLAGEPVAKGRQQVDVGAGEVSAVLQLEIERPALWWPNGEGEQPLYEVEIEASLDGNPSDRTTLSAGLRSLRLEPNRGAPADARPYQIVVNGRPIYARGWNWVPIDMLYGVPRPAKLHHLLGLARDARVNLLRVWGGGLIESEELYGACDRLGILLWQEFIQSSSGTLNAPSDEPEFVAMMAAEAEQIVPLRRNHPSLALWCGGNELMRDGVPLDERAPVLGALGEVVRRLDPDRPFLPTSPSGPLANFTDTGPQVLGHDVHGPWEHQGLAGQQQLYDRGRALLHSEFGVEGMASLATLEATIPPERRWPPGRANPVYAHRGAWWINEPLVQAAFGGGIADLSTLVRASQLLQADGLRYALESHLRRRPLSSGSLPWQFNEPFPNAWCTSAVDYYGRPKPAYFAVACAYEPLHVCASFERLAWAGAERFSAGLWAVSSLPQTADVRLLARSLSADGRELNRLEVEAGSPAGEAVALGELAVALDDVPTDLFLLDLVLHTSDHEAASGNRYLLSRTANLAPLHALPPTSLDAAWAPDGQDAWRVSLRNTGGWLAPALLIEDGRPAGAPGWAVPEADLLTLLPGEGREVTVRFMDVPAEERRLLVSGWNVGDLFLG
jgi:beta-mannosidase